MKTHVWMTVVAAPGSGGWRWRNLAGVAGRMAPGPGHGSGRGTLARLLLTKAAAREAGVTDDSWASSRTLSQGRQSAINSTRSSTWLVWALRRWMRVPG